MSQRDSSMTARIRARLGNQTAPPARYGSGRQLLYQCPHCTLPWYQDGTSAYYRLEPDALARLLVRLQADVDRLPQATCRLCAQALASGVFEIDEFGQGKGGYGLNWEAAEPTAHLMAVVVALRWYAQHPLPEQRQPDIVLAPQTALAVLRWLSHFPAGLSPRAWLRKQDSEEYAAVNPPGYGASGTDGWRWKGATFRCFCYPLGDDAAVTLAIAQPPSQPVDLAHLLSLWRQLAGLAAQGRIAGEKDATT